MLIIKNQNSWAQKHKNYVRKLDRKIWKKFYIQTITLSLCSTVFSLTITTTKSNTYKISASSFPFLEEPSIFLVRLSQKSN